MTVLYYVDGFRIKDGRIALLPGIDQQLAVCTDLANTMQGAPIELHRPDGTVISTVIDNYFVELPKDPNSCTELSRLPLVLVFPIELSQYDIPAGTAVVLRQKVPSNPKGT